MWFSYYFFTEIPDLGNSNDLQLAKVEINPKTRDCILNIMFTTSNNSEYII